MNSKNHSQETPGFHNLENCLEDWRNQLMNRYRIDSLFVESTSFEDLNRFKADWLEICHSISRKSRQKAFVRSGIAQLVALSDRLTAAQKSRPTNTLNETGGDQRIEQIEEVIAVIWEELPNRASGHQPVSTWLKQKTIDEIRIRFQELSLPVEDPDHPLMEKLQIEIEKFLNGENLRLTYEMRNYILSMLAEIAEIRKCNKQNLLSVTLMDVLISFNFNPLSIVHFLVSFLMEDLKNFDNSRDQLERLNHWSREMNQIPVKKGYGFNSRNEAVHIFLDTWIQEEIEYLEKSRTLSADQAGGHPRSSANKVETDLSVAQLACLFRLFKECGVVKNENIRELLNLVASSTRSKKQENISGESLRLKYYDVEESTRLEVQKIFFRFLKKINQPF